MKLLPCITLSLTFLITRAGECAAQQDTLYYDPASGNYIITYLGHPLCIRGLDGTLRPYDNTELQDGEEYVEIDTFVTVIFQPATKINPIVHCIATHDAQTGSYLFSYEIENGSDSRQNLVGFILEFGNAGVTNKTRYDRWENQRQREADGSFKNLWSWWGDQGLEPTWSTDGFALESSGLPGIMNAYFRGHAPILAFPTESPGGKLGSQIAALRVFPADHVVRRTVSPVTPPSPFVALEFLDTISSYVTQSHALKWIANQLTVDKYTNLFSTARSQLVLNDSTGTRSTLATILTNVTEDCTAALLTSEAYALLRYNTEYLLNRLNK